MIKKWALMAFILNLVDCFQTIYALEVLGAKEANPAMAYLYNISPYLFFLVKVSVCHATIGYMVWNHKKTNLKWVTFLLGGVVVWNVVAISIHIWS